MPISLAGKAIVGLVAIGALGAFKLAPPDTRGQTVLLERLANRIDRAQSIAPQTSKVLSDMLNEIRRQPASNDRASDLETRRQLAIARIERVLQTKLTSRSEPEPQSSPVARK